MSMSAITEFRWGNTHQIVKIGHCVMVFGGFCYHLNECIGVLDREYNSYHVILVYNLYTDEWRKYMIPQNETVPSGRAKACAVAVGTDVYMFGGEGLFDNGCTNELWNLTKTQHGRFGWNKDNTHSKESTPSPRFGHSAWAYKGNLWVFGGAGYGSSPTGYLNSPRRGFYPSSYSDFVNNQLLCYKPFEQNWSFVQMFGAIPAPRVHHVATVVEAMGKAWVYGGDTYLTDFQQLQLDDFHELNLSTFTWTLIETSLPETLKAYSFTAVDTKLVLTGGIMQTDYELPLGNWILDLTSMSWRHRTFAHEDHYPYSYTGYEGLNNSVIFIGGEDGEENNSPQKNDQLVFSVMFEPKTLQQVATQTIHKHRDEYQWEACLPNKLLARFRFI